MKYGFIGCGNMGSAIAKALSTKVSDIMVSDRSGKAASLGFAYGSAETVAQNCDALFLAVKPQMMGDVLAGLSPILKEKKPLLITMAAGLTMDQITQMAGVSLSVIRIMPNTPVAIGKGVTLYCANTLVSDTLLAGFLCDMENTGKLVTLPEAQFDAGTSLSGCGPAYVYMFIEAMADGAVACGVPRAAALELAAATASGAAEMVKVTSQHPGVLKDAVCSPGGSTIAGVKALEEKGLRGTVMDAIASAYRRNQELGK